MPKSEPKAAFPSLGQTSPLVSPLYTASVYTIPDLDTLDLIMDGERDGFFYARDGHPNAESLAQAIARLESAEWCQICSSGMAAISTAILAVAEQGDRIIASHRLYGKTTQLLADELSRYGIETTFVDAGDLEAVEEAFEDNTKLLLVETLSNPHLRMPNIPELAKLAKRNKCLLFVDNTFATPVLCRPLELGAHLVTESLTKLMGGHSDVTLGALCGVGDLGMQIRAVVSAWGFSANPFDCWQCERGLLTLEVRAEKATQTAQELAPWLAEQGGVERVIYPGLESHPDHELVGELMHNKFGNMLCFELKGGRAAVNRFLRAVPEIPFSPSLGHVTTTLSHPWSTSHRQISPAEKKRQGITEGLIRLSVGVEALEALQAAIAKGLS